MIPSLKKLGFLPNRTFIIAEAGVNHNGSLELAYKLIDVAKECGADAVKFQTFITEESMTRDAGLAEYQKENLDNAESQFSMAKALELSFEDFRRLKRYCDQKKIIFLSTPDEIKSLKFLVQLKVPMIKIGSGDITNKPLLEETAKCRKPILLSTGASSLGEVQRALKWIYAAGERRVVVLHCVSDYPAPINESNVHAMVTMRNNLKVEVGFSDHALGFEASLAAVALGARVVEKHFTLDKKMAGPDHIASLDPKELKAYVDSIRRLEGTLGDGIKKIAPCEKKNVELIRRSIVSENEINSGDKIFAEDISIKKPGYGVPPFELNKVVGARAKRMIQKDTVIVPEMLK